MFRRRVPTWSMSVRVFICIYISKGSNEKSAKIWDDGFDEVAEFVSVREHWDSPLLEPSQAPNHRPSFIFFLDMRVLSSMLLLYSVLFGMMIEVSRFCFLRPMGCEPFKAADISAYLHIISHIISHEVPTMWCPLVVNGFINPIIVISTINIHKP